MKIRTDFVTNSSSSSYSVSLAVNSKDGKTVNAHFGFDDESIYGSISEEIFKQNNIDELIDFIESSLYIEAGEFEEPFYGLQEEYPDISRELGIGDSYIHGRVQLSQLFDYFDKYPDIFSNEDVFTFDLKDFIESYIRKDLDSFKFELQEEIKSLENIKSIELDGENNVWGEGMNDYQPTYIDDYLREKGDDTYGKVFYNYSLGTKTVYDFETKKKYTAWDDSYLSYEEYPENEQYRIFGAYSKDESSISVSTTVYLIDKNGNKYDFLYNGSKKPIQHYDWGVFEFFEDIKFNNSIATKYSKIYEFLDYITGDNFIRTATAEFGECLWGKGKETRKRDVTFDKEILVEEKNKYKKEVRQNVSSLDDLDKLIVKRIIKRTGNSQSAIQYEDKKICELCKLVNDSTDETLESNLDELYNYINGERTQNNRYDRYIWRKDKKDLIPFVKMIAENIDKKPIILVKDEGIDYYEYDFKTKKETYYKAMCLDELGGLIENIQFQQYQNQKKIKGKSYIIGHYPQGKNGEIKPIEWEILEEEEDNKILVISKYGLDFKKYNEKFDDVTWETCTLRKWLNNDFINEAFTKEEQSKIVSTKVTADKNPKYNTDPGKDTEDKAFLLSIQEANEYFVSNVDRECKPTEYAIEQGAYEGCKDNCFWWLRSPGHNQYYVANVNYSGNIYEYGHYVCYDNSAVRPALWINLES